MIYVKKRRADYADSDMSPLRYLYAFSCSSFTFVQWIILKSTLNDENRNVINNKVHPRIEYTKIKTLTDFNIGNKFTNNDSKFSLRII